MASSTTAPKASSTKRGKFLSPAPKESPRFGLERQNILCCLLLFASVVVFYSSVTKNQFMRFDDGGYIVDNAHVKAGLTWKTVEWALLTGANSNWHPLTWLSHALDCQFFGVNPVEAHWVNVLLHALNAALLFLLFQFSTGCRWRSFMVAGLFALHPINVESVAWAAERKTVLSTFFFLLAFLAYVWYTRRPARGRYFAMAGLYALALMAKPQVITFPFLLLLWDYWPLRRVTLPGEIGWETRRSNSFWLQNRKLVIEKIPLFLLTAASAAITVAAQSAGHAVRPLSQYGLLLRVETSVVAYVRYLGKAFWPAKLAALYPHPTQLYPAWQAAGALFLLLAITAVVLYARERRYLAIGWFWFLGSLVPMIGLVQVGEQALADRYAYISFIGIFLAVVWWAGESTAHRHVSPRWLAAPAISCLLVLGVLTYRQVKYWHDSEGFWRRTIALTQDNYFAHGALADFLRIDGRLDEAAEHYRTALAIHPDSIILILDLGAYEQLRGNLDQAMQLYQQAIAGTGPDSIRAKAYCNLGFDYHQKHQLAQAKDAFEQSLKLDPKQPDSLQGLGVIDDLQGDFPDAVKLYVRAMELQPTDVGYLLLAHALQQEGDSDHAKQMIDRAASLSNNLAESVKKAQAVASGRMPPPPATASE